MTMPKDDTINPTSEQSADNVAADANVASRKPKLLGSSSSPRLTRDVCDPKFGSWCDDSSTEEDNDDDDDSIGGDSFDSNDNIVIHMASLTTETCFTSFYFSVEEEQGSVHSLDGDDEEEGSFDEEEEEEDFNIRISQKRRSDEEIFLENLKRRQLRFSDKTSIKEFEPAPDSCRIDMYYSVHQLQRMMDAYREGREFQLEE